MCHRIDNELRKIGMGYQRTHRVENQDDTVLPRSLRLDESLKVSSLRLRQDAGTFPHKGTLTVITGAPM